MVYIIKTTANLLINFFHHFENWINTSQSPQVNTQIFGRLKNKCEVSVLKLSPKIVARPIEFIYAYTSLFDYFVIHTFAKVPLVTH